MEIGSPAITRANCSRRLVPAVERGPSLHKMTMYLGARSVLVHVKTFRSASRDNLTFVIAYRARRRRSLPFLSFAFPPPCIRLPQLRSRPPSSYGMVTVGYSFLLFFSSFEREICLPFCLNNYFYFYFTNFVFSFFSSSVYVLEKVLYLLFEENEMCVKLVVVYIKI